MTVLKSAVVLFVEDKIKNLKQKVKPNKTYPKLKQDDTMEYLKIVPASLALASIEKASNTIIIFCKRTTWGSFK